jgi:hypothetical protein
MPDRHDVLNRIIHAAPQEPRIAARVDAVVRDRVGREAVSPRGDIVVGELKAATEKP